MDSTADLNFAYKYPFSNEAKEIVQKEGGEINIKYLDMAGRHLQEATASGIDYTDINISYAKQEYVMTYLYSRMLLSAVKRPDLIRLYANAEAKRSSSALLSSDNNDLTRIAMQLNIKFTSTLDVGKSGTGAGEFSINFIDYVKYAPRTPSFELVNQRLSGGVVVLDRNNIIKIMQKAAAKEIMKGLPIKASELPKQVIDYSKQLRFKQATTSKIPAGKKSEEWIEKLLQTPIADVRHRAVNLILAPYLTNTKGFDVEQASKIILGYIERCKTIDPSTKVNESYIRYQCNYAKRRGLKPLSVDRARELLGNQVDFESSSVEVKKR